MKLKDYITMITAIIGMGLGIINLIINIQSKLKEKIKIYHNDLDLEYKLNGTEKYYETSIEIPLNINYCFNVLNKKNETVVIEDTYIYIRPMMKYLVMKCLMMKCFLVNIYKLLI